MPQVENPETKGFLVRMIQYFGPLPGQGRPDQLAEINKLTPEDKLWFVNEFNKAGMPTNPPQSSPAN